MGVKDKDNPERMRIGELAEHACTTTRTIRYYEKLGLIAPSDREGSGFRYYTPRETFRLARINALKELGLSLEEVGQVIDLYEDDPTMAAGRRKVLEILEGHLAETGRKLENLQSFRADLERSIADIRSRMAKDVG